MFITDMMTRISDTRYINRVFGTLRMFGRYVNADLNFGKKVANDVFLEKIMAASMMLYYPLEHLFWITKLKYNMLPIDGLEAAVWSNRAWLIYVVGDFVVTRRILNEAENEIETSTNSSKKKWILLRYRLWLHAVIADIILAIQFSLKNPPFNKAFVTVAGLYGSLMNLFVKLYILPRIKA